MRFGVRSLGMALVIGCTPAGTTQTVGVLQLLTVSADGGSANGKVVGTSLSADGRVAAFEDTATNLTEPALATDPNFTVPVMYARETCFNSSCTASTTIGSLTNSGALPSEGSGFSVPRFTRFMSLDGRFLVYDGAAQDFSASPPLAPTDGVVVLRDTCRGQTHCTPAATVVSLSSTGNVIFAQTEGPTISGNGRTVAFMTPAAGVTPGALGGNMEVYARDTCFGAAAGCTPTTLLVSVNAAGDPAGPSTTGNLTGNAAISDDGRFVAFVTDSANMVPPGSPTETNVFLRDTCIGGPSGCTPTTILVSANLSGAPGTPLFARGGSEWPSVNATGRYVFFRSDAIDLVGQNNIRDTQLYLRDTCAQVLGACTPHTTLVTADSTSQPLTVGSGVVATDLMSSSGRYLVFQPGAPLHPGDVGAGIYASDTCNGAPAGCVPSVKPISLDAQGKEFPALAPVSISGDGHTALLFDLSGNQNNLYLALTGY